MIVGALVALLVWVVVFYWANQNSVAFGAVIEAFVFAAGGAGLGLLIGA